MNLLRTILHDARMVFLAMPLMVLALSVPGRGHAADPPICGDVNDSGAVNTSDALLVLKKGVGQDVELPCSGYEGALEACQADLAEVQANLAAYQPVACPCFAGPASLAATFENFVPGPVTSGFGADCQLTNGANTLYFSLETADAPYFPVPNDGKCSVGVTAIVSSQQSANSPSCSVSQSVRDFAFDPGSGGMIDDSVDCEAVPRFDGVSAGYISQAELAACYAQIPIAASLLVGTCAPVPCESTAGGLCWFQGQPGESCDSVCARANRPYDTATDTYAGSQGTDEHCAEVGASFSHTTFAGTHQRGGLGCHSVVAGYARRDTDPTTSSAASNTGSTRFCACN